MKLLLNPSYNVPGTDVTEVEWIKFNDDSESSGGSKWPHAPRRQGFSLLRLRKVADSDEEDGDNRDGEENNEDEQVAKKAKSPGSKKDALNGNYLWLLKENVLEGEVLFCYLHQRRQLKGINKKN